MITRRIVLLAWAITGSGWSAMPLAAQGLAQVVDRDELPVAPVVMQPLPAIVSPVGILNDPTEAIPAGQPTAQTAPDDESPQENGNGEPAARNGEGRARQPSNARNRRSSSSAANQQQIERGRVAFQESCTQCHDAERALQKRKSRAAWLTTVRRMARMEGADIPPADHQPIAAYLASLSAPPARAAGGDADGQAADDGEAAEGDESTAEDTAETDSAAADELAEEVSSMLGSDLNIGGTVSTLWRGGNDNLENPGFFADVWVTADWQPSGPLRGRVTVCTSCHSDQTNGGGFTFELVEGSASVDLLHWFKEKDQRPEDCKMGITADLKAGRFVVPFGAYAAMSHPGAYRTVTNPLIYNMGRQVLPDRGRPPVLPMPYSDEGIDLDVRIPLTDEWDATMDVFVVNGLQAGGQGINFTRSRSYTDNNHRPAVGGRATVGNSKVRLGGSVMSGEMQPDQSPMAYYHFAGGDVTGRFFDNLVRVYFEYAIRRNDSIFPEQQIAYGTVSELELLLLSKPNLSLLGRYDTLEFRDFLGDDSIGRFTWGLSTTAIGGSLLMLNHERWEFRSDIPDVDVLGLRWVVAL